MKLVSGEEINVMDSMVVGPAYVGITDADAQTAVCALDEHELEQLIKKLQKRLGYMRS